MSDREEGEIVDDDFEDISDNSIIEPCTPAGKSVSSKDNLRALSLSSLTDFEEIPEEKIEPTIQIDVKTESHSQKRTRKRPSKPKPKQTRKRKRSYRKPLKACSDSDGEDYKELNRRLQQQLKAAIHVNGEEEAHKNSLRTRLKAMTKAPLEAEENKQDVENTNHNTNTIVREKTPEESNKDNPINSEPVKESNDDDTELMQLRLEALRTAVVNKFKERKKRKVAEVSADESDTNKENANLNIKDGKKAPVENDKLIEECKKDNKLTDSATTEINKNNEEATPEDDEDILRAHLLASMSKKLLTMTKSTEDIIPKPVTAIVPVKNTIILKNIPQQKIVNNVQSNNRGNSNFKVNNMVVNKNKVIRNVANINNKVLPLPLVKPFIIQVSGDSDSEDDTLNKTVSKNTEKTTNIVNKKTELTSNNIVTLGIESTVDKFLREQRAKVEAEIKINGARGSIQAPSKAVNNAVTKPQKSPVMEKSAVKLLPKSKQIEYQKLLLRIKNAEKRPRLRKTSHRVETKVVTNVTRSKLLNKSKVVVNKMVNAKLDKNQERVVNKLVNAKLDKSQERRTEALLLHNTLKEMQEVVDQRLQIRDRYKVLRPLIKNVNEASKERRKHEQEVKRLLEQLTEAKKKQADAQEAFSMCVKKLVMRKEEIEKRCSTPTAITITPTSKNPFTSTPIREKASVTPLEISSIPNSFLDIPLPLDNTLDLQKLSDSQLSDVNIGDPNDIDMIISKQRSSLGETSIKTSSIRNERTSSFLKYESPLVIVKSSETSDPFSILCPFEVDGTCKDNECTYKHFLKR